MACDFGSYGLKHSILQFGLKVNIYIEVGDIFPGKHAGTCSDI
jgi:hypothetical protein